MFTKTFFACLLAIPQLGAAVYTLNPENDYSQNFFDKFDFFTDPDPTHGFVEYVDSSTAYSTGLVKEQNGQFYIGTDSTNVASNGRPSVRLQSKATYDNGLFILDLKHMPGSICGTWPAFWTVGPDWPNHGEVDIIEGVNTQSSDSMTLHTGADCAIGQQNGFTGEVTSTNCDVSNGASNQGCSISNDDSGSYGSGLNDAGGAVYATEITSSQISVWQFAPNEVPSDIASGHPDPSTWPMPAARFAGGCDISSHINQQSIVFDLTFCGDWAGDAWSSDSTCSSKGSSCQDYVANNPSAFADAYWLVNDLKVYTGGSGGNGSYPNSTVTKRSPIALSEQHRSRHASHLLRHLKSV